MSATPQVSGGRLDHLSGAAGLRPRVPSAVLVVALGHMALAVGVCGSVWIAVGASDGGYLLELPNGANPAWIDGPLRGLAGTIGGLAPSALSVALIGLLTAYVVALICAGSIRLRYALGGVVLANLAFTLGPTLVSTDVFGYIAYAREAALHGLNPYLSAAASAPHDAILPFVYWKTETSPYGPLFTGLSVPLGLVSLSAALWTYKALAGLASVALVLLVADIARRRGASPTRAAILVGLNPVLLFYAVSGAHNDLLAALLVAGAVWLAIAGRDSAATGVAVCTAAIKLTLGLALPFVLVGVRRRGAGSENASRDGSGRRGGAWRGVALAVLAIGVPTLLLFGTHLFDQLHRIATDTRFDIAFSGPDRLAAALGTQLNSTVRIACTGAAGVASAAAIIWAWRGGDWITAAGWAFLALIASIASLAPWYLIWLLPLAALGRSRRLRLATLLATGYLIAVHLPALGGRPWLSGPASARPIAAATAGPKAAVRTTAAGQRGRPRGASGVGVRHVVGYLARPALGPTARSLLSIHVHRGVEQSGSSSGS